MTLQIIKSESNPLKFNRRQSRASHHIKDPTTRQTIEFYSCMKTVNRATAALFDRTCDASIDHLHEKRVSMMQITTDQIRAAGS